LKFGLEVAIVAQKIPPDTDRSLDQATLAQLVEHSIRNRKVVGSNPTGGSIKINNLQAINFYSGIHFGKVSL
jgi:hypothetical protein